jgi:DNA-binding GntR family transcriptional regulator
MELERIDTQRAYELIHEKITTLELLPGASIDEAALAKELDMGLVPVREALKLLIHNHLVEAPPRGLFVADVNIADLEQISDIRLILEPYCVRQAAKNAIPDDLVILDALCMEQAQILPDEPRQLFDLDHKFHQAIARAAKNKYLAEILEVFYGQSKRLWYLALPQLEFLPAAVETHVDMVEAIKNKDADKAEDIMRVHIQNFYDQVFQILKEKGDAR